MNNCMQYKLMVLMPNYNQGKYIAEALDSVLMQKTEFNFQITIIDDASTDCSLKIAQEYQAKYPDKIKIIKNETNLKLARTILKGYESLATDYFCVLDPDDYWTSDNKLQRAVDFLDKNLDFSIYITNTILLKHNKEAGVYVQYDGEWCVSNFEDLLDDKAVLSCTLGSIYRNTVFKHGVPKAIYDKIGTISEDSFRGDSFRNYLHLSTGKAYFFNDVDSVYRMNNEGLWTSLSPINQKIINAHLFVDMYEFFKDNSSSIKLLKKSYNLYKVVQTEINYALNLGDKCGKNSLLSLKIDKLQNLVNYYSQNKNHIITGKNYMLKYAFKLFYYSLPMFRTSYSSERRMWLINKINSNFEI